MTELQVCTEFMLLISQMYQGLICLHHESDLSDPSVMCLHNRNKPQLVAAKADGTGQCIRYCISYGINLLMH